MAPCIVRLGAGLRPARQSGGRAAGNVPEQPARHGYRTRTPQVATGTGDGLGRPVSVFQSLAPGSAAAALFQRSVKLDLSGITTIRIPLVSALPPVAIFISEDAAAPNVQWTWPQPRSVR